MGKDILIVSLADFDNRKQDIAQQLLAASKVCGRSLARKYREAHAVFCAVDIDHRGVA